MYRDIFKIFYIAEYVDRNILYRKSQVASVRSWPMCKQLARGRLLPTRHFLIDHLATWSPSKLTLRTRFTSHYRVSKFLLIFFVASSLS